MDSRIARSTPKEDFKMYKILNQNVIEQMLERGIYSQDADVNAQAMQMREINSAMRGSTTALNYLWAQVKNEKFLEADYQLVKKIHKGESVSEVLSNGRVIAWSLD